jgi:hypothetical protein
MGKLLERMQDASRSGVYRARSDTAVLDALQEGGLPAAKVSLKGAASKQDLLERIARALKLPDWFGNNWDALEDCLTEVDGYLLFYDFQEVPADDRGVLIDVLASSAEFRAQQGEPFFAVFVDPQGNLDLDDLFRGA